MMRKFLEKVTLLLTLTAVLVTFTFAASASEDGEDTSAEVTKDAVYSSVFSCVVDGRDNTVTKEVTEDGLPAIKAAPNHESELESIMALDNYNLSSSIGSVDLALYKYITVIYKYTGDVPSKSTVPVIYIATHNGEIKGGAVTSHVRTEEYSIGWRATLLEIPDLTEKYQTPDAVHILQHFHLNPYGRSLKTYQLPENAACYIHGIAFHTEKPETVGIETGYISGYEDGTFGAGRYLTRAEACAAAARILGGCENFSGESSFSDVPSDKWYSQYIAFCESKGLLGCFSGEFLPDSSITRAELADIFIKLLCENSSAVTESTLLTGHLNSRPDRAVTRAEAVAFIDTVMQAAKGGVPSDYDVSFSDVSSQHWAFESIVRASGVYTYVVNSGKNVPEWMYYEKAKVPIDEALYLAGEEKQQEINRLELRRINEIRCTETDVTVTGTSYYVSEYGDDDNSGLSEAYPLRTLDAVNALALLPGDAVFFERGGTYRGFVTGREGVTYSAYGEGEKPILTASPANFAGVSNWELTDTPNVWKLKTPVKHDVGLVVFNGGEAWTQKRIKGRSDFPDGELSDLDVDLAMWHDVSMPTNEAGYVYVRSDSGNPGKLYSSIELSPRQHIIKASADGITVDNLCFKYTGAHAISSGNVSGLTVQNCEFDFIGGSWFRTDTLSRFGNAVEIYGSCDGYTVENCYMRHVYDAGMTHQLTESPDTNCIMKDIRYVNNVVTDTSYPIEYFIHSSNEGIEHKMINVEISGNLILRTGYGFGDQRPDRTAPAHIKGWNAYNEAYNFTISANIFGTSKYRMMQVGAGLPEWMPLFDGNTYIQNAYSSFGNIGSTGNLSFNGDIASYIHSSDPSASVFFLRPVEE